MNAELFAAQTAVITALSAFYTAEAIRLTAEQPALATTCTALAGLCNEIETLTPADDAVYAMREATIRTAGESYAALSNVVTQDRLQALEYQGVEIDLELVRFYLFGREMVVAPNV